MLRQIELTQIRFRIGKVDRKQFINKVCINKVDCAFFKYWNEVTWWFKSSNRKLDSREKLRLSLEFFFSFFNTCYFIASKKRIQQLINSICNYFYWIKEETCNCIKLKKIPWIENKTFFFFFRRYIHSYKKKKNTEIWDLSGYITQAKKMKVWLQIF